MDWLLMRILLYSGFAAVAILLIYFGLYWSVPTTSQYWGFARGAEPAALAAAAYERGDYRFLSVQFDWQGSDTNSRIAGITGCWNHPDGEPLPARNNEELSIEDSAAEKQLFDFASRFNVTLALLMNKELRAGCTIVRMF